MADVRSGRDTQVSINIIPKTDEGELMKFVLISVEQRRAWVVEAKDKHNAIAKAVENGYTEDMSDFYYGLEDGQIRIYELEKWIK